LEASDLESGFSNFRTTAWSVVLGAQKTAGEQEREKCLALLCRNYWKPIYYYFRRRGLNRDDAIDMTQEYFSIFLEKDFVSIADRDRGRFRTFVLVTANRFLTKQLARRARRESTLSFPFPGDSGDGEGRMPELATGETAEDDFNRRWAISILESAMERMRRECGEGRRKMYYLAFQRYVESSTDMSPPSYRQIGEELGVSELDVTNFLHRGRNIFHKMLRNEIRELVTLESEVDAEIEALKEYLRR
jgi:RNA polymerase sigma-70 factor (ECF subfamily)